MKAIIKYIKRYNLGLMYFNKTFKELTTLKIGGKIKMYFLPHTISAFIKFYKFASRFSIPIFILGSGSNILPNDKKFAGIVVSFKNIDIKYAIVGTNAIIYAGTKVSTFVYQAAKLNLGGVEFLAGIPGSLGGVVAMNAGSFGHSISDFLISSEVMNQRGEIITLANKDLQFGYRKSLIKIKDLVVLSAKIKLEKSQEVSILHKINIQKQKRIASQPLNTKNAGCAFQNPPHHSAWYLIEQVGMRGAKIGDAKISNKHANFFINEKNAKAIDMYKLIKKAQAEVKRKFQIELIPEWVLFNFPKQ